MPASDTLEVLIDVDDPGVEVHLQYHLLSLRPQHLTVVTPFLKLKRLPTLSPIEFVVGSFSDSRRHMASWHE